jgi:carbon storage regulator CsrA
MLVLTRKKEQKIQIGRHVTVTILRVRGGAVRVGIEAPPDMKILRGELSPFPASHEPRQAAGTSGSPSGVSAHPDCQRPGRASGSEPADAGDEGAAPSGPAPGLADLRRRATKRSPAPPGLSAGHAISLASREVRAVQASCQW